MSLDTWMAEFYPQGAGTFDGCKMNTDNVLAAVDHSLRKWRGLTKENREKHGLEYYHYKLYEVDDETHARWFSIDSASCALCFMFLVPKDPGPLGIPGYPRCLSCPLSLAREGLSCDEASGGERMNSSPFSVFIRMGDPAPMITLLEKARALVVKFRETQLWKAPEKA